MPHLTFTQIIGLYEGIDLDRVKFSTLFMSQIEGMLRAGQGAERVLREIQIIESGKGISKTRPAEQFKHLPLKGLWKKHYFTTKFLAININNYWHLDSKKSQKIKTEISKHCANPDLRRDPVAFSEAVSQTVVADAYKQKYQNCDLTGEWIIYSEGQGKRYYLALADHNEGDENIYKKILAVCNDEINLPP